MACKYLKQGSKEGKKLGVGKAKKRAAKATAQVKAIISKAKRRK